MTLLLKRTLSSHKARGPKDLDNGSMHAYSLTSGRHRQSQFAHPPIWRHFLFCLLLEEGPGLTSFSRQRSMASPNQSEHLRKVYDSGLGLFPLSSFKPHPQTSKASLIGASLARRRSQEMWGNGDGWSFTKR